MRLHGIARPASRIALVNIGQIDALGCGGMHCLGKPPNLGPVVGTSGGDVQRQHMPQRVDCQVQLGAVLALGAVVPGAGSAFG